MKGGGDISSGFVHATVGMLVQGGQAVVLVAAVVVCGIIKRVVFFSVRNLYFLE